MALIALEWFGRKSVYDRLMPLVWVVAFLGTIYTAGLLGQSSARELWHAPTEVAQMLLAATLAGSAVYLLLRTGGEAGGRDMTIVLGLSAAVAFTIYAAELVVAPQRSEEAEYVVHLLLSGELRSIFVGGLFLGFLLPALMSVFGARRPNPGLMSLASAMGLVGLWMVKHAWLIAPQLVPLS
jgi:protein NrfD